MTTWFQHFRQDLDTRNNFGFLNVCTYFIGTKYDGAQSLQKTHLLKSQEVYTYTSIGVTLSGRIPRESDFQLAFATTY